MELKILERLLIVLFLLKLFQMKVLSVFLFGMFGMSSCFQTLSRTRTPRTLRSHDPFLVEVYNDIKNVLVPHDVYSTVAAECANIVVQNTNNYSQVNATVQYKLDSVLFCCCFFLGIPQTFNPVIVSIISVQSPNDSTKKIQTALFSIFKWLIYNYLSQTIYTGDVFVLKEETILFSSFISTLVVSTAFFIKSRENNRELFLKKEVAQIVCVEHFKQILNQVYPLHTELPFASLLDTMEMDFDLFK